MSARNIFSAQSFLLDYLSCSCHNVSSEKSNDDKDLWNCRSKRDRRQILYLSPNAFTQIHSLKFRNYKENEDIQ